MNYKRILETVAASGRELTRGIKIIFWKSFPVCCKIQLTK